MRCDSFSITDKYGKSVENFIRKLHPDCEKFIIERSGAYFNITAVPPSPSIEEVKPAPKAEPKASPPKPKIILPVKKETESVPKRKVRPSTGKRSTKRSR